MDHQTHYSSGGLELYLDTTSFKPSFTNGDKIEGSVVLKLSKPQSIENIVLRHKVQTAIDFSILTGENRAISPDVKYITDSEDTYVRDVVVFPTAKDDTGKSINLPAGIHTYPFSVAIPDYAPQSKTLMPPSWSHKNWREGHIDHFLQVQVKRSSAFKSNAKVTQPIVFTPSSHYKWLNNTHMNTIKKAIDFGPGSPTYLTNKPISSDSYYSSALVECEFPAVMRQAPDTIPISINLQVMGDGGPLAITKVMYELIVETTYNSKRHVYANKEAIMLSSQELENYGNTIDISSMFDKVTLPEQMVPSFSTNLISRSYSTRITVTLADPMGTASQNVEFNGGVTMLSPHFNSEEPGHHATSRVATGLGPDLARLSLHHGMQHSPIPVDVPMYLPPYRS